MERSWDIDRDKSRPSVTYIPLLFLEVSGPVFVECDEWFPTAISRNQFGFARLWMMLVLAQLPTGQGGAGTWEQVVCEITSGYDIKVIYIGQLPSPLYMLIKYNYILATSAVAKGVSYLSQCGDDQAMKN